MTLCERRQLRHFLRAINRLPWFLVLNINMEQNSIDITMSRVKTENLINAIQNEPSIWDTKLNSSEEEKELAWTRIAGVLHYSKSKLIYLKVCHVMSSVQ